MSFLQDAPQLPHPWRDDRPLRALLERVLSPAQRTAMQVDIDALADYALIVFARRASTPRSEPALTQWGAWGQRVDRVELTSAWREGAAITTARGLIATGHESGAHARLCQFVRVYLYHVASEFYSCPLAMTDGAATAIKASGNADLIKRALPHFLSRDADTFWLSGQWMTENTGGSDVGRTETVARQDDDGQWRLYGRKWFTSAIVGEAALALARPQGSGEHADALALFYVETKTADGDWSGVTIDRLKDKLGTRELPTAEIHLDGVPAWPLGELAHGVRQVAPMLNVTRTWNAVGAVASMARAITLARDYATRRQVFGKKLIEQPLHARTLADMQAEFEGAFALTFFVAESLGRVEDGSAAEHEPALLRLLTPLAKLWTGKLAVAIASEALECFGGNGYIEDTGLPQLLRDAQVYSIWEGTTNVLSLDTLRALGKSGLAPLRICIGVLLEEAGQPEEVVNTVGSAVDNAETFLDETADNAVLQAGARGLALTLARVVAVALLARQAAWSATHGGDARPAAARDLFLAHGIDCLQNPCADAVKSLLGSDETPL